MDIAAAKPILSAMGDLSKTLPLDMLDSIYVVPL